MPHVILWYDDNAMVNFCQHINVDNAGVSTTTMVARVFLIRPLPRAMEGTGRGYSAEVIDES